MEFTEQQIADLNLSEEQVKGLSPIVSEQWSAKLAEEKKAWDGKANENANKIIDGASKRAMELTGVNVERQQGEKYGDYLVRIHQSAFEKDRSEISRLKTDYEAKLKDFKGDENLKNDFEALKTKHDAALQKYADYDTLKETAGKYETANEQLNTLTNQLALNDARPQFPDTVNKYEADAKFNEVISKISREYDIKFSDGKGIAVSKENEHVVKPLSEIVKQDATIAELLKGRQQGGPGADPIEKSKIEGVPFDVPKDAKTDPLARSKAIEEHLKKQGIDPLSTQYAEQFAELNQKIRTGQTAA